MAHRLYSSINILGLAVGLASCILMALFVRYELSYDTQYAKSDRIARMHISQISSAGNDQWPRAGAGWKVLLEDSYPELIQVGRISITQTPLKVGDIVINEVISYADPEIFDIFELEFIHGDKTNAFKDIKSVVLTEDTAKNLFGDLNPMGKMVTFFNMVDLKVTGVIKNLPQNTHLANNSFANILAAAEYEGGQVFLDNLTNMNFYTYLEFSSANDIKTVSDKLNDLVDKNLGAFLKEVNVQLTARLMPLNKLHLYSQISGDMKETGDINQVYLFSAIAILILIIAGINFMNLATARASQRAKEVGVKKSFGVTRNQIIVQFLSESVILSSISLLIALALVELTLPTFSEFVNREISFNYLTDFSLSGSLLALTLLVGLLAGSYPALYLSAFSPAKVLKGDVTRGKAGAKFRQILVVLQFFIATVLIISTLTVYQQMKFAQNIKLGYEKDQTMIIYGIGTPLVANNYTGLQQEMKRLPGVHWVEGAQRLPGNRLTNNTDIQAPGGDKMIMPYNSIDYNFFQNFGIELAAGRYFDKNYAKDTLVYANEQTPVTQANIIINQMAAKKFGWSDQQAIGKTLNYNVSFDGKTKTEVTVVGVVKDYHFESVREELKPIVHFVNKTRFYYLALKLDNKDVSGTIAAVENTWKKLFPTQDFSYSFLDDNFNAMYEDEKRVSGVYGVFSILAVCIACLGLFGLASFTTERRTKEIGVRKVLGASSQSIVLLLTKEFSKLVLLASAFAWPVAWYLMNDWLQNFAFSIELSMGSFLIGTIMALIVAWFTVGGQAAKAAMARPVDSLKYE